MLPALQHPVAFGTPPSVPNDQDTSGWCGIVETINVDRSAGVSCRENSGTSWKHLIRAGRASGSEWRCGIGTQ